ncbi:hypothetical protein EKD16_03695 [Streptomonospora litoralis]|uniref:Uncharacterized protein n=1 Tax=Streptomonospora litoralis TaxID=2498135 RepID=A0A4P6Q166_9ACTN|nr:hypothetical protein EKD16_03695 [Streptomonospora litoralis]
MGTLSTLSAAAPATPAQAVTELHARLADVGAHRLYAGALDRVAVLSVRRGLTVWCWGGLFRWRDDGGAQATHPVTDPDGAARRLSADQRTAGIQPHTAPAAPPPAPTPVAAAAPTAA